MTRKYLLTAHNDVYFSSVKYKVICALTLLWIGKREEPMQVQEKVPKGNDSERGLYLLPDITSHYFLSVHKFKRNCTNICSIDIYLSTKNKRNL